MSRPARTTRPATVRLIRQLTLLALVAAAFLPLGASPKPLGAVSTAQASLSWRETGLLNTGRCCFSATLLADGRVLVAGGAQGDSNPASIDSAEIFDPLIEEWTPTGAMTRVRQQHSATLLPDGRVLVAGGAGRGDQPNSVTATAELYDPATGIWRVTEAMAVARANHFAVLLPGGRVLVGGGYTAGNTVSSAEIYDLASERWSPAPAIPWQAQQMTATTLRDGTILVAGGWTDIGDTADSAIYNPATNTWGPKRLMPRGRATHSAELLSDGRVIIIGYGREATLYQPTTSSWASGGQMSTDRQGPMTALLASGQVLAAGGRDGFSGRVYDSSELFDPTTSTWLPGPRLNQSRMDAQMVALPDRSVLAIGGQQNGAPLRSVERYGPVTAGLPVSCTTVSVTILENGECTIALPFQQVNTSSSSFRISARSSDTTLLPEASLTPGGSGTERTLTIRPARTDARTAPTRQGEAMVTVTATDGTITEQFSIAVTIIPPPWLVMLYLNGDDGPIGGATSARFESIADAVGDLILRLERMPFNPAMRLVVLADLHEKIGDSRVYVRDLGGLTDVTERLLEDQTGWPGFTAELNTADPSTVQSFVRWARARYPGSTYSFLSLVDHGGGWAPDLDGGPADQPRGARIRQAGGWRGMSIDYTSGGQSMSTRDTGEALQGLDLDVVFFDACFMGMLESAYEVREHADFLIAGQNQLFAAFPYDDYFHTDHLTAGTIPQSIATTIVERYNVAEDVQKNPFAIAAIDLRQLRAGSTSDLARRVNTLAMTLLAALPPGNDPVPETNTILRALRQSYEASQKFDYDSNLVLDRSREGYVDLRDFVRQLQTNRALPSSVLTAAGAVEEAIRGTAAPVVVHVRRIRDGEYRGNPMDLAQADGLSIYLPLGERDERPTAVDPENPDCPAKPERQLGFYADPAQLSFTRDYPAWAALLVRLEGNVTVRRAPLPPGCSALLGAAQTNEEVSFAPFRSPAPLPIAEPEQLFLPFLRR